MRLCNKHENLIKLTDEDFSKWIINRGITVIFNLKKYLVFYHAEKCFSVIQNAFLCIREQHQIPCVSIKHFFPFLALILVSNSVNAEHKAPEKIDTSSLYGLQYENDAFLENNKDHYYTNGFQLTILRNEEPAQWIKKVTRGIPFYQQDKTVNLVQYTVGHKMFTPDNISIQNLQPDDRPYAGYLYFSTTVISHSQSSNNFDKGEQVELTFGLVGPSAYGEELQTFGHKFSDSPTPRGWKNQLNDELTIGLKYSNISRKINPISDDIEFGINQHNSVAIGNAYTYGSTGVMFRLGDNLRQDLSPPNIHPSFSGLNYFRSSKHPSWYLFLGLEARLIYRNIFLDGNTFTDSHKVEKKPWVGEIQYGFVYLFDGMRIAISNMTRSIEYTTQKELSNYGIINFSFKY